MKIFLLQLVILSSCISACKDDDDYDCRDSQAAVAQVVEENALIATLKSCETDSDCTYKRIETECVSGCGIAVSLSSENKVDESFTSAPIQRICSKHFKAQCMKSLPSCVAAADVKIICNASKICETKR
ncbi:MAG: hypothetical protein EOP04_01840 [Proteobacteria bacterium]|nr:MAG: hypothetical protein EOP04_01840 [Pseudomonadota bacterium]